MKILYHHRILSKDGQDVHIEEMIAALRRRGHEVVVVAPPMTTGAEFGSDGGFIATLRARLPRALSELLELAYALPAYRRLLRAWKTEKPDILYERYNLFFPAGYWLKRRTGIPYLLEVNAPLFQERSEHGGLALRRIASWSERRVWLAADRVLPVTRVLAGHVGAAGVPEERIRVIPNGVNRARFGLGEDGGAARRELGLGSKLVLGFTGFMRSWHGLNRVLAVMDELRTSHDLHFLVIGDGPARAELEEAARRLDLTDRLTILGIVERDRVGHYLAAFDIALQPQVVEYASPLKLFEYMALGQAILAPDTANIREVLTNGADALLFSLADERSFHDSLSLLCRDAALRRRLGAAAAETIERGNFTWDGNAARVEAMARELTTGQVGAARTGASGEGRTAATN